MRPPSKSSLPFPPRPASHTGTGALTRYYTVSTETVVVNGARVRVADLPPDVARLVLDQLKADEGAALRATDIAQAARVVRAELSRLQEAEPRAAGKPPVAPCGEKAPLDGAESTFLEIGRPAQHQTPCVPQAPVLERDGEDMLYLAGRWLHRCAVCGPWECLIERRVGANPDTVWVPAGWVPRSQNVRHSAECPHWGAF